MTSSCKEICDRIEKKCNETHKIFKSFMADPANRRSSPEYHAFVAVRELPSCQVICLAHPEYAEYYAQTLNKIMGDRI